MAQHVSATCRSLMSVRTSFIMLKTSSSVGVCPSATSVARNSRESIVPLPASLTGCLQASVGA